MIIIAPPTGGACFKYFVQISAKLFQNYIDFYMNI